MVAAVPSFVRVGRGGVVVVALSVLLGVSGALSAQVAEVLFPRPLHLVRKIDDPLAGAAITVDQYCAGNRIVTVRGQRVAIADYGKQELTEIDRAAGTYSVTSFDALAKIAPAARKTARVEVEVTVSERIALSRDALDVLIGAAYPNPRRAEHDAIVSAITAKGGLRARSSGSSAKAVSEYALPTEQVATFDAGGGETVTVREAVVHIGGDAVPAEVLLIPPGATRVESPRLRAARELRALDELPPRQ